MDPAGKAKDPSRAMQNGRATVLVDLLFGRLVVLVDVLLQDDLLERVCGHGQRGHNLGSSNAARSFQDAVGSSSSPIARRQQVIVAKKCRPLL